MICFALQNIPYFLNMVIFPRMCERHLQEIPVWMVIQTIEIYDPRMMGIDQTWELTAQAKIIKDCWSLWVLKLRVAKVFCRVPNLFSSIYGKNVGLMWNCLQMVCILEDTECMVKKLMYSEKGTADIPTTSAPSIL